jgi:hypothetical protein
LKAFRIHLRKMKTSTCGNPGVTRLSTSVLWVP